MLKFDIKKRTLLGYILIVLAVSLVMNVLFAISQSTVLGIIFTVIESVVMAIVIYEIYSSVLNHLTLNGEKFTLDQAGRTNYILLNLIPTALVVIIVPIMLFTMLATTSFFGVILLFILILILLAPIYTYYINRLIINNAYGENEINIKAKFIGEIGSYYKVVVIQSLLTLITFGLYYPVAFLKITDFYVENIEFKNYKFSFTYKKSEFWLKSIGFTILTIFTLGIAGLWFIPWIINYVVDNTKVYEQ